MKKSVILAYSGGATTSLCIHYLAHHMNLNVIVYMANLSSRQDIPLIIEDAYRLGASQVHISDLRGYILEQVAFRALKAGAEYANGFFLARSIGNSCILKGLVDIANDYGIRQAAHGSSFISNEGSRFENLLASLAPEMGFISPPKMWDWTNRDQVVSELKRIMGSDSKRVAEVSKYSKDENLWGRTMSFGPILDHWEDLPSDVFQLTQDPINAPDEPDELEVGFVEGVPRFLNGKDINARELVEELTFIGAEHGIGRADLISDGLTGIKYREACESPAATILFAAHKALELMPLSQKVLKHQEIMSIRYGEAIMNGNWFTTLRYALDKYFDTTQARVTGTIRIRLCKGTCTVVGRKSPHSLIAGISKQLPELFKPTDIEGYNKITTVQNRLEAIRKREVPKEKVD